MTEEVESRFRLQPGYRGGPGWERRVRGEEWRMRVAGDETGSTGPEEQERCVSPDERRGPET